MNQPDFFEENENEKPSAAVDFYSAPDITGIFELSVEAFYSVIYARMSCLPIQSEIFRFIEKVKRAGKDRAAAAKAAFDRGDPDVLTVLRAAGKVLTEIHRLTGFLRFNPDSGGVYIARCSPDYFILPALAEHFTRRFGDTPWAIIDEKRKLCLCRENGGPARLIALSSSGPPTTTAGKNSTDPWEELWKLYHRSVNNEGRKNPNLQRQFIPERYHKYLPEMK